MSYYMIERGDTTLYFRKHKNAVQHAIRLLEESAKNPVRRYVQQRKSISHCSSVVLYCEIRWENTRVVVRGDIVYLVGTPYGRLIKETIEERPEVKQPGKPYIPAQTIETEEEVKPWQPLYGRGKLGEKVREDEPYDGNLFFKDEETVSFIVKFKVSESVVDRIVIEKSPLVFEDEITEKDIYDAVIKWADDIRLPGGYDSDLEKLARELVSLVAPDNREPDKWEDID